jgi:hypothetical protein
MVFLSAFTPVLAKHPKSFSLVARGGRCWFGDQVLESGADNDLGLLFLRKAELRRYCFTANSTTWLISGPRGTGRPEGRAGPRLHARR